jgi:L-asparaginase type I
VTTPAEVLVLYTGGTIGMRETDRGYAPQPGFLESQLRALPQFHDPGHPALTTPPGRYQRRIRFEIREFSPLVDSSSMGVDDWVRIAHVIGHAYRDFDGFVVLHGTDTMAYTASALSFMLEHLGKPVVFTGSQIPLSVLRNDAIDNLLDALTLAGLFEVPEVGVFFHHKLLRGNRCRKTSASSFDAFRSGNYPPLAEAGVDIAVDWSRIRPVPRAPMRVRPLVHHNVVSLRLFPGLTEDLFQSILEGPVEGVVLETYGAGNAPPRPRLIRLLEEAHARGLVVVNVTQCHQGTVRPSYASGRALADAGVVGGADMTPEAALTKLTWLCSQGLPSDEVRRQMGEDLRGELTPSRGVRTRAPQ